MNNGKLFLITITNSLHFYRFFFHYFVFKELTNRHNWNSEWNGIQQNLGIESKTGSWFDTNIEMTDAPWPTEPQGQPRSRCRYFHCVKVSDSMKTKAQSSVNQTTCFLLPKAHRQARTYTTPFKKNKLGCLIETECNDLKFTFKSSTKTRQMKCWNWESWLFFWKIYSHFEFDTSNKLKKIGTGAMKDWKSCVTLD